MTSSKRRISGVFFIQSILNKQIISGSLKKQSRCQSWYTHKRLRNIYRSLRNNTYSLFVYHDENDKNIPNTTNKLEGLFSELKRQLNCHKSLYKQYKLLFINDFLGKRKT